MGAVATTGWWNMVEMQTPVTGITLLKRRGETKSGAGGRKAKNEPVIVLLNPIIHLRPSFLQHVLFTSQKLFFGT
jgi:hypothetical protein